MHTPASRYSASTRSMPSQLPQVEYGPDDIVRRVGDGGRISFRGHKLRVGKALIGQYVALRARVDREGAFNVYFCHQKLDAIELDQASFYED